MAAYAHEAVDITIRSDGTGAVWATLAWTDGDPLTDASSGSLFATTSDGRRVGPAGMGRVPNSPGTLAYAGTLEPGTWHVSVDVALPALGHCEADVVVAPAAPSPKDTVCRAPRPPAATVAPTGHGAAAGSSSGATLALSLAAVTVAAGVALGVVLTARTRRRPRRPTR